MALYGFYHDVDLELSWITEHYPSSGSTNYDKSLSGAISLMQKHKVLPVHNVRIRMESMVYTVQGRLVEVKIRGQTHGNAWDRMGNGY